MILQHWKPIVSDSFPTRLTFWINVHGIPLHCWKDATIDAIGAVLGPIVEKRSDKARLRVQVNGLEPLIMRMDLQLPSNDIIEVELEYEKLEKHCFLCKSLSHEHENCTALHRLYLRLTEIGADSISLSKILWTGLKKGENVKLTGSTLVCNKETIMKELDGLTTKKVILEENATLVRTNPNSCRREALVLRKIVAVTRIDPILEPLALLPPSDLLIGVFQRSEAPQVTLLRIAMTKLSSQKKIGSPLQEK